MLQWLPSHRRGRLRIDLLAGAIVAALVVPQSLGYATVADVPVQVGLYAVPLALLAVALRAIESLDETRARTAVVAGLALVATFGGRHLAQRLPWGLVVLELGLMGSRAFDLEAEDVAMIGKVPSGLPPLSSPFVLSDDKSVLQR